MQSSHVNLSIIEDHNPKYRTRGHLIIEKFFQWLLQQRMKNFKTGSFGLQFMKRKLSDRYTRLLNEYLSNAFFFVIYRHGHVLALATGMHGIADWPIAAHISMYLM